MQSQSIQLNTNQPQHIIIIGAGFGGLALGQALLKHGITCFTIYERDLSTTQQQDYRIRISKEGYEALQTCLPDHVLKIFCETTTTNKIEFTHINHMTGKEVTVPIKVGGPHNVEGHRPNTSDRSVLRSLLMTGLEPFIKFGYEFDRFENNQFNTGINVLFKNGKIETGCILIAADGVFSKVRKQALPDHTLVDTDGRAIFGKTLLTPEFVKTFPPVHNITLLGSQEPWMTLFIEPVLTPSHNYHHVPTPHPYLYWVMFGRSHFFGVPDSALHTITHEQVKDLSLKLTSEWHPSIRSLFEMQSVNDCSFMRMTSCSPNDLQKLPWNLQNERVTFIGDSIHALGLGANTAFRDAALLCEILCREYSQYGQFLDMRILREYEERMRSYAVESVIHARSGGSKMFNQPEFTECKVVQF